MDDLLPAQVSVAEHWSCQAATCHAFDHDLGETTGVISTFQALAVALLALLPGASYTFAYERVVGGFGVSLSDRLVRFLAASALFAALFSGPGMLLYRNFVASGQLGRGDVNAVLFELVVLAYVVVPTAVGSFVGYGQKNRWQWITLLIGDSPEPRAWDYLWRPGVEGVVRVKLKSGSWLGGVFGTTVSGQRSYAAGYPEKEDLYLSLQVKVDAMTGEFEQDLDGGPVPVEGASGLLLRWEEIEYLDFQEIN